MQILPGGFTLTYSVSVRRRFGLWFGLTPHNVVGVHTGNRQGQSVNISKLPINQPESMGIRRSRGIAEEQEDVDRSHFLIDHVAPIEHWQLIHRKAEIAGIIGIIEVPGRIYSSLKAGAWGSKGYLDGPV